MMKAASYCLAEGVHSHNYLMHQLDSPPKQPYIDSDHGKASESKESIKEHYSGGWSFVEELANNPSPTLNQMELPVRPRMTRSLSTLSSKSLEMCTESLGSETAAAIDNTESIDEISSYLSLQESRESFVPSAFAVSNEFHRTKTFPPPLTSRVGGDGVKVMMRPLREGGRLVVAAISVTKPNPFFQSDRTNGRLRLSFKMANPNDVLKDEDVDEEKEDPVVRSHDEGEDDEKVKI